jgi:GR25 family glycosyltransferase involved in LPS biosynthesis
MVDIIKGIDFYCLNFTTNPHEKNERRIKMEKKFDHFNIPVHFYSGVEETDNRIHFVKNLQERRTWSICYGHLDMIHHFVQNSEKEYIIVCEDDILIRNDFIEKIGMLLKVLEKHPLDVVLLGYLCYNPIDTFSNFPEIKTEYSCASFKLLQYPNEDSWGSQMYMLSKLQSQNLLLKYYKDYAIRTITDPSITPFSADWTITKDGNRALVYPLLAIEDGQSIYKDKGQKECHERCFDFSYKPHLFR